MLRHRMALNFAARADGVTLDDVIDRLLRAASERADSGLDGDLDRTPAAPAAQAECAGSARCRRCWSPPSASPPPSTRACTAAAASARATPSGSSAATSPATPPRASTGANRPRPTAMFVRETEWEAAQTVWLWRDASPSMRWSLAPRICRTRTSAPSCCAAGARRAAGPRRRARRAARHRRAARSPAAPALRRLAVDACDRAPPRHDALACLPRRMPLPRHGHVVLFSDFLAPLDEIDDACVRYSPAWACAAIWCRCSIRPRRSCPSPAASASRAGRRRRRMLIRRVEAVRDGLRAAPDAAHRDGLARHRAAARLDAAPCIAPTDRAADARCWRSICAHGAAAPQRSGEVAPMLNLGARLAFAAPWLLARAHALPILWWLLRVTPPAPEADRLPADPPAARAEAEGRDAGAHAAGGCCCCACCWRRW